MNTKLIFKAISQVTFVQVEQEGSNFSVTFGFNTPNDRGQSESTTEGFSTLSRALACAYERVGYADKELEECYRCAGKYMKSEMSESWAGDEIFYFCQHCRG